MGMKFYRLHFLSLSIQGWMASPLPRKKIMSLTLHIHGLLFFFLLDTC